MSDNFNITVKEFFMSTRYGVCKRDLCGHGCRYRRRNKEIKRHPGCAALLAGDDVTGFDHDGPLTGGIQTTGNYPGKARTPEELMADMDKAMSLCPGKKKLNLHASYAIFEKGELSTAIKSSLSILRSGSSLQKRETWVLTLILHSFHILR